MPHAEHFKNANFNIAIPIVITGLFYAIAWIAGISDDCMKLAFVIVMWLICIVTLFVIAVIGFCISSIE